MHVFVCAMFFWKITYKVVKLTWYKFYVTFWNIIVIEVFAEYLSYKENHVGVFTDTGKVQNIDRQLEKELIEMMGQEHY